MSSDDMKIIIESKPEAKPIPVHLLELWKVYRVVSDGIEQEVDIGDIVIRLPSVINNGAYILNCTKNYIIWYRCGSVAFSCLRVFDVKKIYLAFDEEPKP